VSFHQLTAVELGQHVRVAHDDRPIRWPAKKQLAAAARGRQRHRLDTDLDPHAQRRADLASFLPGRVVLAGQHGHAGHAGLCQLADQPVGERDAHQRQ
jgi:hypothetical protein